MPPWPCCRPTGRLCPKNPADTLRQSSGGGGRHFRPPGALDLVSRLASGANVTRETVDGLDLVRITLDRDQVIYGYVDRQTVLLAYAPGAIKACMAIGKTERIPWKRPRSSKRLPLSGSPLAPRPPFYRGYLNLAGAAELLATAAIPEIRESGANAPGYGLRVRSHLRDRAGSGEPGLVPPTATTSCMRWSKARWTRLGPNRSLHLLKEGTLAYNWASSLRPEMIVKTLSATDEQGYRLADDAVREVTGVSLADLGKAFGPQYGGVLDDIVRTPFFLYRK
jgi:hypothetical protein